MSRDKILECHWSNAKVSFGNLNAFKFAKETFGKFISESLLLTPKNFRKETFGKKLSERKFPKVFRCKAAFSNK